MLYLNNAATSFPKAPPGPQPLLEDFIKQPFTHGGRSPASDSQNFTGGVRQKLAETVGLPSDQSNQIVFTGSCTLALNLIVRGFIDKHRNHNKPTPIRVLCDTFSHNAILRPLYALEQEQLVTVSYIFSDLFKSETAVAELEDTLRQLRPAPSHDPLLICVNARSNVIGVKRSLQPVVDFCAQDESLFLLVDGAQTAGYRPHELTGPARPDAWTFAAHKGLLGWAGLGGFFIRDPESLHLPLQGGTGFDSANLAMPDQLPDRFEPGTLNGPGLKALEVGLDFLKQTGLDTYQSTVTARTGQFIRELRSRFPKGIFYHPPEVDDFICGPFLWNYPGVDPAEAGQLLFELYDIEVRAGLHCAPLAMQALGCPPHGALRISPGFFNRTEDVATLGDALDSLLKQIG